MRFLIYKLYRFALAQERTVPLIFGFLMFLIIFETLHITVLAVAIKILGYDLFTNYLGGYFGIVALLFLLPVNYFFFVRTKWIYKVNHFYQNKNIAVWKGNFIFISYIIFLFAIMVIEALFFQIKNNSTIR